MKIILFGGSGFVGTALTKKLKDKSIYSIVYDKRKPVDDCEYVKCDVANLDISSKNQDANIIINLAAEHRDDVTPISKYYDVNVEGAKNVCEFASLVGVKKIIFTSSVAIYGFAKPNTAEDGEIKYFNEYGKTKYLAEKVYRDWQEEDRENRSLVIIRPTVIFGPGNRGNVYNFLRQIASRRFIMFGNGKNIKSMAYVENVVSFICYCLNFEKGIHIYNYVDKPDLNMNALTTIARKTLFNKNNVGFRLPGFLGVLIGYLFDAVSFVTRKKFPVSSIRVKKFMSYSQFSSAAHETNFIAPFQLSEGLTKTLSYEFIEDNSDKPVFETE